jgi:hypothetical protein
MKKKNVTLTDEQRKEVNKQRDIKNLQERINNGQIPQPTRLFKVGDECIIGCLNNIHITEVLFNGMGYAVHYDYIGQSYGKPIRVIGEGIWDWLSVLPITAYGKGEQLSINDDIRINYYNNSIDSLLNKVYQSGVDFNPNYQRDLVWSIDQKLLLIDSIFNNIEIGKFTFIKYNFSENRKFYYEILDGKQRLSTICEFYEDRFSWNGKKFTELCAKDANHFTHFPIIQGEVSEITEQQIYKLFIKMNTTGMPVSQEHLNKIKSLIN